MQATRAHAYTKAGLPLLLLWSSQFDLAHYITFHSLARKAKERLIACKHSKQHQQNYYSMLLNVSTITTALALLFGLAEAGTNGEGGNIDNTGGVVNIYPGFISEEEIEESFRATSYDIKGENIGLSDDIYKSHKDNEKAATNSEDFVTSSLRIAFIQRGGS